MRQPTAPSAGRPGDERVPTVVAAAAVLASAAALLALQAELTFRLDDWAFLLYRRFGRVDAVLNPHNEHIVFAPVLLYKALLAAFGAEWFATRGVPDWRGRARRRDDGADRDPAGLRARRWELGLRSGSALGVCGLR